MRVAQTHTVQILKEDSIVIATKVSSNIQSRRPVLILMSAKTEVPNVMKMLNAEIYMDHIDVLTCFRCAHTARVANSNLFDTVEDFLHVFINF